MLNADPALSAKAAAGGYKAVAVAIHSQMREEDQIRLLADYKSGLYMAVVGDEKFKEGFDHPPMKTVIDYPHSSLVDKAQIIGRGARQWANPPKEGRMEGLTFVDTIVYNGSDDAKEDERLKAAALRNAVLAWDILQGTVVLSPGMEERLKEPKEKEKGEAQPPCID